MKSMTAAAVSLVCLALFVTEGNGNAFDDYIARPDPTYTYRVLPESTRVVPGEYTAFVLNMTSQTWLTPQESSQPVWWHYLIIMVPDVVLYSDTAFVYITGGSNRIPSSPPDPLKDDEAILLSKAALKTGMVGAVLQQVPNQPIFFPGDPRNKSRSEDDIIAYTWRHFIEGGQNEPDWLLRFPMTKAAVRAMDTITEFANRDISKFFVAGASKRGWTTWTTAAMDKRVIGIAPLVLDCLNFGENLHHMYRSLGGWTFAFEPYWSEDVCKYLDSPSLVELQELVDPYAYIDRLTMPKCVVSAGGDEFFLPDDSHYYYNDMKGPTYLRIHANAEHSLILHHLNVMDELSGFMLSVIEGIPLPQLSWDLYENATHGVIRFYTDLVPMRVTAYRATTLTQERRDFRLARGAAVNSTEPAIQPVFYKAFPPTNPSKGVYIAEVIKPALGWTCFFVVAEYPGPRGTTVAFTSEANIVPDYFPFPQCKGDGCIGTLV
ncbi:putative autocrine proliferation repressor protein A-like [Apostichopus japonicus]|uniref:Putative autocrine proliferation repressor protein A-like n=1 Tax=Stichopus japonicus TaxID=307972 RepID=A0A2G8KN46_STIJA|nr:putative autocrine proliferation repressor protein A-like [Apostichopus japonicus]